MATVTPVGAGEVSRADRQGRPGGRGGVTQSRRRRQGLVAWLFALPFVLGFGIFMLLPIVSSFVMSFTDFTSSDVQVRWQKAVGDLPAVQSAWKDPALANDPKLSVFGEQLKDTNSPPSLKTWTQVSAAADRTLEQIIRANVAPQDAMKSLQATANSIGTGTGG